MRAVLQSCQAVFARTLSGRLLLVLWLLGVAAGLYAANEFATTAGEAESRLSGWPAGTTLQRQTDRPTLIVFLHPRCSCSVNTVAELQGILQHYGKQIRTETVLYSPADADADWFETSLVKNVSRLSGVHMRRDVQGRQAQIFGAHTSGQTFLYDADGTLLFAGGNARP